MGNYRKLTLAERRILIDKGTEFPLVGDYNFKSLLTN
jgi:hypothetical protein